MITTANLLTMTPKAMDAFAKAEPGAALRYAADRLTPERLAWCKAKF